MKINYLTTNSFKFKIAKQYFEKVQQHELVQQPLDTPEIQADNCAEVAKYSALYGAEKLGEPCVKMDAGFFIPALGGFPGPFVKYVNEWLSEENILAMLAETADRRAYFTDATAIALPDGTTKVLECKWEGHLAEPGNYRSTEWPVNSLFIPSGHTTPLGMWSHDERVAFWGDGAWNEVVAYLESTL